MTPFANHRATGCVFALAALIAGWETHFDSTTARLQLQPLSTAASGRSECRGTAPVAAQEECRTSGLTTAQEMWNFAMQSGDGFGNEVVAQDSSHGSR